VSLVGGAVIIYFETENLTDNGCQVMAKAHLAFWPGELKKNKCIVVAIKNLNFCPYPTLRAFSAAVKSHIYFF
jgi:hypothetical protein